jgi:4-hydroxy-3-polyprenylbenzoate decarboxylase
MHVTAVTHRANPVFPAMVRGEPPHESGVVDRAMQRIFLPLVKLSMPELVDYDLPMDAAAEHWATISIDKTYAGQARRVAHAAWGMRPLMFAKFLVVVDAEVDVRDHRQVLAAIANHVSPGRDVFFQQGPPNPWDAATTPGMLGQKMAIDATAKLPEEQGGPQPERAAMTPEIVRLVGDRWTEYGLGPG